MVFHFKISETSMWGIADMKTGLVYLKDKKRSKRQTHKHLIVLNKIYLDWKKPCIKRSRNMMLIRKKKRELFYLVGIRKINLLSKQERNKNHLKEKRLLR